MLSHQLPSGPKWKGAAAILFLLGCMIFGPALPLLIIAALWFKFYTCAIVMFVVMAASYYPFKESALFARVLLCAAYWFDKGVFLWWEDALLKKMGDKQGSMWCMHPHGTSVGFGFLLNGALRYKAAQPKKYLPEALVKLVSPERLQKVSGVQAPLLFKLPLTRTLLLLCGCATPATKEGMAGLFQEKSDYGILPGGMEEVVLFQKGHERVYLRSRAGFIKYALQYGYLLVLAYTFGECDLFDCLKVGIAYKLRLVRKYGFVIPIFWGDRWYCPLLPRDDIPLNTVVGAPIQLPKIENPTVEEVEKYHALYISELTALFDRHKAQFGYADRTLEVI